MLGTHSKCSPGSITVTAWRRDNLIAAVRPAKLPPMMAMEGAVVVRVLELTGGTLGTSQCSVNRTSAVRVLPRPGWR